MLVAKLLQISFETYLRIWSHQRFEVLSVYASLQKFSNFIVANTRGKYKSSLVCIDCKLNHKPHTSLVWYEIIV